MEKSREKKISCRGHHNETKFKPSISVTSRTHVTNKGLELRSLAGSLEKLRYMMIVKKLNTKIKLPYRILSDGTYRTENISNYRFYTGSKYSGPFGVLGCDGHGEFQLVDGSIYKGNVLCNMFSGYGSIFFPNGGRINGFWVEGQIFNPEYIFKDGLHYAHKDWPYCTVPDRRFFSEYECGLKPSGNIQLANDHPARAIPKQHYDSGEGFFNPHSGELIHPMTGEYMRIPSDMEQKWILNHCRREWITPLPFKPENNENLFSKFTEKRPDIKHESLWEALYKTIRDVIGGVGKIESVTGLRPDVVDTDEAVLQHINEVFIKRGADPVLLYKPYSVSMGDFVKMQGLHSALFQRSGIID